MAAPVEEIVTAAVLQAVDGGALAALLHRQADPDVVRRLAGVEARLLELADLWAAGELPTPNGSAPEVVWRPIRRR